MGKRPQPTPARADASTPPEAEALRERIDSLKLKLTEQIAQAKTSMMDILSHAAGIAFFANAPIRAELNRQIKEAEQRLAAVEAAERRLPTARPSPAKTRSNTTPRVRKLEEIATGSPKARDADLCQAFDRARLEVPASWKADGIDTWTQASQQKRHLGKLHSIIYKYKHPRPRKP